MKGKRILVTGGAGFIGSHIVEKLYNLNEVTVFDNLSSGKIEYLKNFNIDFIKGDIRNLDELLSSTKEKDIVIHLAANPDVRRGELDNHIDLEVNVIGTYNVLEAMRRNDVSGIIFSSSSTVYGEAQVPTREDYGPLIPISFYGASKLAAESYISSFSYTYGMKGISFRFANVVGSRGTHGVIYDFILKLKKNRNELEILGDGTQTKSYIHVEDCVDGMLFAFDKTSKNYDVFNIGTEDSTNVMEIAKIVVESLGLKYVKLKIKGGEEGRGWKGDVKRMLLSIDKIKSLGWYPSMGSTEAVKMAVKELIGELYDKENTNSSSSIR
ncbi:MAG: NAD-dependent epimerase/dehydratase family protein [Thermoplasmata archaeon]